MAKHPCSVCGSGYGECAQGLRFSLQCCDGCHHPTRWVGDPYTVAEVEAMWEGRGKPPHVVAWLHQLRE